jgi:hypothetical protein
LNVRLRDEHAREYIGDIDAHLTRLREARG